MTENDNFRYYYGQSLINEEKTVSEYKSILDYIKTHGGSGSGIDADMLDGYDSSDFLLRSDDTYMPAGFYIGYTSIMNSDTEGEQFLDTRDIEFTNKGQQYEYMFNTDLENTINDKLNSTTSVSLEDILTNAKNNYYGDWEVDHQNQSLNAGLFDLESTISYALAYMKMNNNLLQSEIDNLPVFDSETFDKLQTIADNNVRDFYVYDENGNVDRTRTEQLLDAGAVNGLRFILATQEQYEQYPTAIRENPYYIFIIRDDVPDGYIKPTTISAGGFKPLFKADGKDLMVSIDDGLTYYKAGNLYQSEAGEEGLIPVYNGNGTLPKMLTNSSLGDAALINLEWMEKFLSGLLAPNDKLEEASLETILNNQLNPLEARLSACEAKILNLNDTYQLVENKRTSDITNIQSENSEITYPTMSTIVSITTTLQSQIEDLNNKIGQLDELLSGILGTGNNNDGN